MRKILISFFLIFYFGLASARPQRDEEPGAQFCLDFANEGYNCTTARQCTLSKCLKPDETKDDEEKIIPEYSDVNPLDIRSPVESLNNPCFNQDQVKRLTSLSCPDIRTAIEDDDQVCCHNSNIIKDVKPEPSSPPSSPPPTPTTATTTFQARKCRTHVEKGISPRQGLVRTETVAGEWPHMCALFKFTTAQRKNGVFLAGASLIAPGIVLTVAHWVEDLEPSEITVRCGIWNITGNEYEEKNVSQVTVHPAYDRASLRNDFALVHLEEDFEIKSNIETICLPESRNSKDEFDPKNCIATGWGRESQGDSGRIPDLLKQTKLPIVDQEICQSEIRKNPEYNDRYVLHPSFICAGGEAGRDTCRGDGGGPLVCKRPEDDVYIQTGIVSWGIKCGRPNTPGIYASTSFGLCFIDWATKCIHGDKFNEFYNIETECSNWADVEKASLEKKLGSFQRIIADSGSDKTLVDYAKKELPKYEKAVSNLVTLQGQCGTTKVILDPRIEEESDSNIRSAIPNDGTS